MCVVHVISTACVFSFPWVYMGTGLLLQVNPKYMCMSTTKCSILVEDNDVLGTRPEFVLKGGAEHYFTAVQLAPSYNHVPLFLPLCTPLSL